MKNYRTYLSMSWDIIMGNLPLYLGLSSLLIVVSLVSSSIPVAGGILSSLFHLGFLKMIYQLSQKREINYQDFFWSFLTLNRLLNALFLEFIHSFAIVLGLIFFVVPGVWVSISWILAYPLFVLSEDPKVWNSIQKSMDLVKGRWWWFAGFVTFLLMINLLGLFALGVGVLVTIPLTMLSLILVVGELTQVLPTTDSNSQKPDFSENIIESKPE